MQFAMIQRVFDDGTGAACNFAGQGDRFDFTHSRRSAASAWFGLLLAGCIAIFGWGLSGPVAAQEGVESRYFHSSGVDLRYIDVGNGEPVLLMHGFTSRLDLWNATGVIDGLVEAGSRVIAYDARGHGESDKPREPGQYGVNDVEDTLRLLDHLSVERAHVVGHSRGASIASRLVVRYPARIRSVVFAGWAVGNPVDTLPVDQCRAIADSIAESELPSDLMRALQSDDAPDPDPAQQARMAERIVAGNDMKALGAAFRSGCGAGGVTADDLAASGVAMLAMVGAHDGMVASVRTMGRAMGDALELFVIPGADHYTLLGHPGFVDRLASFLE
ncbi:MAG: alpha/beta hydrolase [Wenzhouxiangellaceae bacterium]|nr:alpha/beta hydrolase [Wenzhouxiangellaceae bacterium]